MPKSPTIDSTSIPLISVLLMFKVRLLVFLASAALAFWTLRLRRRTFADKTSAVASMFPRSQSTFRLGSGAVLYPRTSLDLDDEPDTTTSTTALPTLIVNEVYLGSLSLDDLRAAPLMDVVADEGNFCLRYVTAT